jgi:TetR/AcrR family transcriptional regulator, transcriptional repressor of aconitase
MRGDSGSAEKSGERLAPRAEVLLLALDGLLAGESTTEVMEQRTQILAARFVPPTNKKGKRK